MGCEEVVGESFGSTEVSFRSSFNASRDRSNAELTLDLPFFSSRSTRSSISLWRIAIEHEILLGQPARAKGLLYRAIKACPWSKGSSVQALHFYSLCFLSSN